MPVNVLYEYRYPARPGLCLDACTGHGLGRAAKSPPSHSRTGSTLGQHHQGRRQLEQSRAIKQTRSIIKSLAVLC